MYSFGGSEPEVTGRRSVYLEFVRRHRLETTIYESIPIRASQTYWQDHPKLVSETHNRSCDTSDDAQTSTNRVANRHGGWPAVHRTASNTSDICSPLYMSNSSCLVIPSPRTLSASKEDLASQQRSRPVCTGDLESVETVLGALWYL